MKKNTHQLASAIHIGGREEQQDSVKVHSYNGNHLLVVADGMGGHRGGQLASRIAVDHFIKCFDEVLGKPSDPSDFLKKIIIQVSEEINRQGKQQNISPRTTIVAAIVIGSQAYWAHVGDSRLYYFKKGEFEQRTRDHSVVQMLLDTNQITEEEMGTHPDQNRLLQSVGGESKPKVTVGQAILEADDALLLCSDGLWEQFDNNEMAKIIYLDNKANVDARMKAMVNEAAKRGGPKCDNVSVAIYKHCRSSGSGKVKKYITLLFLMLFLIALAGAGYFYLQLQLQQSDNDGTIDITQENIRSKGERKNLTEIEQIQTEAQRQAEALIGGRYRDHGDGTVTYTQTGLMWMRCSIGQQWNSRTCTGEATSHTWAAANAFTNNHSFAGYSNWRLPNVDELYTLVHCSSDQRRMPSGEDVAGAKCEGGFQRPTINQQAFPATPAGWFWSASPVAGHSGRAWSVYFFNGYDDWSSKSHRLRVRLVRGGQ